MLSTIKEESNDITEDDVIFIIDNDEIDNNDMDKTTYYSGIASIFASQSSVFNKLINKHQRKKNKKKQRPNQIYLKHMTLTSFCFIRNTFYELNPTLIYDDVVDVLYSSIKYQIKPIVKQCMEYLMEIDNLNDYWIVIKSFAIYPRTLFESFFNNHFIKKSQFLSQHIDKIIADDRFITYSSLFQMEIICQFMVSEKLISHQTCYQLLTKWCRYQFNHKFKPLLAIKTETEPYNDDNEHEQQDILNLSSVTLNTLMTNEDEDVINKHMINQWQDLFDDFIPFIDFVEMDLEFLLTQIRSDHIMSQQDLLSILLQKYENDKKKHQDPIHSISRQSKPKYVVSHSKFRNERRVSTSSNLSNISNLSGLSGSTYNSMNMMEVFKTKDIFLTKNELKALTVGTKLDVRDTFGRYLKAEIIERDEFNDDRFKIHFIGWSLMWDKWIDIGSNDYQLITYFGHITDREIHKTQLRELVIGDKVIVKLPNYHKHHGFGWLNAEIVNMDKGQLMVQYKLNDEDDSDTENDIHEFWVHADNISELR